MYQVRWRTILNSNGYTLLEALFQIFVFLLFSQFITFFFIWINQLNSTLFTNENSAWELFVYDFQNYLSDIEEITVSANEVELRMVNSSEQIQINKHNEVIRKQVNHQGHVPLLIGVRYTHFSLVNNELTITVEFLNGLKKERTFFVPIY